ncbi:MAG: inositol monophosphatase [Bacteroidetes bacterium]|nr:inositol monophosphatase [Bacteroidota bacterium]
MNDIILNKTRNLVSQVAAFIKTEAAKSKVGHISLKGLNNLVTDTDKESERRLVAGLREIIPGSVFITEEDTTVDSEGEYQWIIDPIDGTTNFVHNIPAFSISIALRKYEKIIMGIVHEINRNEQFYATVEVGAFLNGQPISVTKTSELVNTVLATGFPYDDFDREDAYWEALKEFTHKTRGIRRFGSAAVDLCYVACGRFDGFFEYSLSPWDVAGGAFIVEMAGGKVTDFEGGNNWLFGREIVAGNGLIHAPCLETIRRHF